MNKIVEQERQKVMNEIKNEISNIAILAASKVIEKDIDCYINELNEMSEINYKAVLIFITDILKKGSYVIYNENSKLSIATDLGHINNNVLKAIEGSSSIMLEANYDSEILKYSPYPLYLKRRISGTNGHLENKDTGKALSTLFQSGLKEALLIHLSKENNFPELAYETVSEEISKIYSNNSLNIKVAPRNEPSQLFNVS